MLQTRLVRGRASRGHFVAEKLKNCKRREKERPGQPLTDAACDQVCNPGKASKPPASGTNKKKKKWVCTLLSLGHILKNMRLDGFGGV